jgi:O-antigen ligase
LLGAWNSLGIFMMFNFMIGLIVLPEISSSTVKTCTLGLMALSALCLVASGSYAGILGLGIGIVLSQALARRKMRTIPILIVCCIGVAITLLFFEPLLQPLIDKRLAYQFRQGGLVPQTLTFRFEVWRDVFLPPILEHLPWPVYPTVPVTYAWQFEESQYVLLLFRTGLSGFIGFLAWVALTVAWLARRLRTSDGLNGAIVTVTLTLIITLAIAGLTNEVFSFSGSTDYLWMMLGMIANAKRS